MADAITREKIPREGVTVRALDVLDLVAASPHPPRFADILRDSGLAQATVHRLLKLLVEERMLRLDGKEYRLGSRLLTLAHAAWREASLAEIAKPILDRFAEEVGETIHLAQLDDAQVLYIDKRIPRRGAEMFSGIGKVGPAYCTGVGKAMLAQLEGAVLDDALSKQSYHRYTKNTLADVAAVKSEIRAIRAEGVAWDREEHEVGITCLAAAIAAPGLPLAALSITTTRRDGEGLDASKPELIAAASEIAGAARIAFAPGHKRNGFAPTENGEGI